MKKNPYFFSPWGFATPEDERYELPNKYKLLERLHGWDIASKVYECGEDYIVYRCPNHHDEIKHVPIGCGERRICPRCGEKYSIERYHVVKLRFDILKVEKAMYYVFTVPASLRSMLTKKENLDKVKRAVVHTLKALYGERVGAYLEWHLWGDEDGLFKPHLNVFVPDIQHDREKDVFVRIRLKRDADEVRRLYRLNLVEQFGDIIPAVVDVHLELRERGKELSHSIKYVTRPVFSLDRLDYDPVFDVVTVKGEKFDTSYMLTDFLPFYRITTHKNIRFRVWIGYLSDSVFRRIFSQVTQLPPPPTKAELQGLFVPRCPVCGTVMEVDEVFFTHRSRKPPP